MEGFIRKIVQQDKVYTLATSNDFSFVGSNLFTLPDGSPVPVWCFWSEEELAEKQKKEDWSKYLIDYFPISNFIEDVLVPMTNEGYIIGVDFNSNLEGIESDPLDMLLILIEELKKNKKEVELENFKSLNDLEEQARKLL